MLFVVDLGMLDKVYFGERVSDYLWFVGIIVATFLLKRSLAGAVTRLSGRLSGKFRYIQNKAQLRDMLLKPIERLLQVVLFYVAFNRIADLLDDVVVYRSISKSGKIVVDLGEVVEHLFLFLFIVFTTQLVNRVVDFIFYLNYKNAVEEKNSSRLQLLPLLKDLSKLLAWSLALFAVLGGVFHVNVPALITGLGIGGVAIALAGKETVENFFAAFTLLSDKPFQVGDYIKAADAEGYVERIGFRSTRLRAPDGSIVVIPNQKLVSQNLINQTTGGTLAVKLVGPLRYGVEEKVLAETVEKIRQALMAHEYVMEPVDVLVEKFNADTIQITITYLLPFPLPPHVGIVPLKNSINLMVYGMLQSIGTLGSALPVAVVPAPVAK